MISLLMSSLRIFNNIDNVNLLQNFICAQFQQLFLSARNVKVEEMISHLDKKSFWCIFIFPSFSKSGSN